MKEMVGGCCVCSDERGWPDNPLVYCDGNGCTVAVHQACYGIVTVPTGPWYCRKCESPERQARVRCELCPSKAGALKRADTGGWAHVVCALYIPEVRFGNVTSMEPIILQLIPAERFNKTCYICQEMGKQSRATAGACMQCNKSGCKQQFHVTCAQGLGLLCEEAGNYLDNVKYCGYCQHHYSKLKKGGNVKTIPPYKPITHDSHSSDSSPEKEVEGTPTGTSATNTTPTTTSTKGGNTKTSANRKSGHQNSAASKTVQSSSKTQTTTSQAAFAGKSHHSSEKSSGSVKKASSPGEGQRRSSQHQDTNTTAASSASPASSNTKSATPTTSAGSVTPQSQSQPPTETTASPAAKGGLIQTSAAKGAIQQTPGVQASAPKTPTLQESPAAVSTIASTPTNTAASTIVSPPIIQPPQPVSLPPPPVPPPKFAPSTFTESVIANNDSAPSYVASDTKQTKKRKAVSQINSSALKGPTEYVPTAHPSPVAPPQAKTDITQPSVSMHGPLQTPPTSMQVDLSTSSLYQPSLPPPSLPIAGTSSSMDRGIGGHSATVSSIIHPSLSGPSTSGTSTSHAHLQVGKYGIPTSGVGESSRGEMPNSLLVSVPLPSAGQGLNLTSQHQMSEQTSTVVSSHSPLGSGSLGRTTSWGGLQVTYEMQPTQHQHMSQGIVDQTMTPVDGKSDKISGMSNSMGVPPVRNKKRAALNATVVSGSVATSTIQSTGLHQLPGPPPLSVPVKRAPGPPLPPSQQHLYQDTGIKDSPPSSPTPESSRAAKSSKVDKISRGAPHMLGNELNPGSAAAARLSEQLSAELAAHSVATAAANQAAGTLVPPPLLNKATSASKSGGTIIMGSGGAQSLDQLLERQWEQGSQFLMEQAQHFDIASLLSCLHQLRTENVRLEEHVGSLLQRRDHLLAVNARLAIPLNTANVPAEPARLPSQNGSQVRPPSTTVRTETAVSDRSHQLVIRDMQPKPS